MSFDINQFWEREYKQHQDTLEKTFGGLREDFQEMVDACHHSISSGGKIMFFGNGGSASDAQHLATELTVRFVKDREPIAAIALNTDTSSLTAIGNDFGFEYLFSRQIDALGKKGDVAIGISTSGNSDNVLKALHRAREKNIVTIGFSGRDGGKMAQLCDILLIVPSDITARIQEMHITLGHMLCGALEQRLGLV